MNRSTHPARSRVSGVHHRKGVPASCRNRRLLVEPLEDRRLLSVGPELVRDINLLQSTDASSPASLVEMGGAAYFIASSPTTGDGIWKSDGTVAGTTFLTGGAQRGGYYSSSASQLANVNGTLFFTAYHDNDGVELFRSNGTAAGTEFIKDIYSGYSSSRPSNLTDVNGTLFFTADDGANGVELWKSDGTAAGTVLVKDILPGSQSGYYYSAPRNLTNVNGTLFFTANDGTNGVELWKSDGTAAGTVLVKDIFPGSQIYDTGPYSSNPQSLTNVNGTLFFTANDGANGVELWKSNGTAAGTVLVKDIADSGSSWPGRLANVNGTLFFTADDGANGNELWKSNGTEAGTVLVKDIHPGGQGGYYANSSDPQYLTNVNGTLFFAANDGTNGVELWKSNGTDAGTVLVKDVFPGTSQGTYGGPYPNSSNPRDLTNVNGTLFFTANDATNGVELWKSSGTEAGTTLVKDVRAGSSTSNPSYLINVNGTLFFAANDGSHGSELWKSNGTAAGTALVDDISGGNMGSDPGHLTNVNGTSFFTANDGTNGWELWKSDGTAAGTVLVKDIYPGVESAEDGASPNSSSPYGMTNVNGTLFFTASDETNGRELWKSDGTAAGTVLVKDILPGGPSGDDESWRNSSNPYYLTNVNGTLFFIADDGASGRELWKSDGTAAGTVLVKDIGSGSEGSYPRRLFNLNGTLFFAANDGINGRELWKSDGTASGTVLVKDLFPGASSDYYEESPNSSNPSSLTNANGKLLFTANDGTNGYELWKSDGTAAGTVLVKDICAGSSSSGPEGMIGFNGAFYFTANDGTNGWELWKTDGTAAGTVMIKDIFPGTGHGYYGESYPNSSAPYAFANVNGTLFFAANDEAHGRELWKTDGTAAGTVLVKDVRSGSPSSSPWRLTEVNGAVFFIADDGTNGSELWKSNGTAAGTVLLDVATRGSSSPWGLTNAGGVLFFSATDELHGTELWRFPGFSAAPKVEAIADRRVNEGATVAFAVKATDPDAAQKIAYSLDPASIALGMTINSATGAFRWKPPHSALGPHTVTVTATDNGTPAASGSATFTITVDGVVNLRSQKSGYNLLLRRNPKNAQEVQLLNAKNLRQKPYWAGPAGQTYNLTIRGLNNKSDTLTVDAVNGAVSNFGQVFFDGKGGGAKITDKLVIQNSSKSATADDTVNIEAGRVVVNGAVFLTNTLESLSVDTGKGNDRIAISAMGTNVTLLDSAGTDTLDFSHATAGLNLDLSAAAAQKVFAASKRTLTLRGTFENVIGTAHDDFIKGNKAANELRGLGGNNVLMGGDGNDVLDVVTDVPAGSTARNLLIGGKGSDTLKGGPGQDLLIGGTTKYDGDAKALAAIQKYWATTGPADFAARCDGLARGVKYGKKIAALKASTVLDDQAVDALLGGSGSDWFFGSSQEAQDRNSTEDR